MTRIVMTNFDYTTKIGSFTVQSISDLELLPKYEIQGKDILNTVKSVNFGSRAFVIDSSKRYILNSDNEWQEIAVSSGSGSSGGTPGNIPLENIATDEEIENIFS